MNGELTSTGQFLAASDVKRAGSVVAERYRLISLLGEGGMGAVWRAEHLGLGAQIAVKLLDGRLAAQPEGLARFHREAQAAASLRSVHVVQVLDHGIDASTETPYIAMELMEGETLAERLARTHKLPAPETAHIMTQVARALSRAHDLGIVHRDLKPANIFLVRNEDEEVAKVLDFGIAQWRTHPSGPGTLTRPGEVIGTPWYMSPENCRSPEDVDHRSDLWALGVIVFECLVGRCPFEGTNWMALFHAICEGELPRASSLGCSLPGVDAWFERALTRDRTERFQSARELADTLRRLCGTTGGAAGVDDTPSSPTFPFGAEGAASSSQKHSLRPLTNSLRSGAPDSGRSGSGRRRLTWGALVSLGGAAAVLLFAVRAPKAGSPKPVTSSQAARSTPSEFTNPSAADVANHAPSANPTLDAPSSTEVPDAGTQQAGAVLDLPSSSRAAPPPPMANGNSADGTRRATGASVRVLPSGDAGRKRARGAPRRAAVAKRAATSPSSPSSATSTPLTKARDFYKDRR
jgi:serine/threonine protein kinase